MPEDLSRFISAQENTYDQALSEIRLGKKTTHWMWFIFPQILGLGTSPTSQRYAIRNISEAQAYLDHPVLGSRLVEIAGTLLQLHTTDAHKIFGSPDDKKLHSCMTLFSSVKNSNPVFDQVLQKFFNGSKDEKTLKILSGDE